MKRKIIKLSTYSKAVTARRAPKKPPFEWISAGPPEPMYAVGDTVVTVNPFTHDFSIVDFDGETPLYYEVQALIYDADDETFRYYLDGETEWIAEEWIDFAPYPGMAKALDNPADEKMAFLLSEEQTVGHSEGGDEDMGENYHAKVTRLTAKEQAEIGAELDRQAREYTIDRLLATVWSGTDEEKAEAKAELAKLVAEAEGEAE